MKDRRVVTINIGYRLYDIPVTGTGTAVTRTLTGKNDHTGDNFYINGQKQTFATKAEAMDMARRLDQNVAEIGWAEVCYIRNNR